MQTVPGRRDLGIRIKACQHFLREWCVYFLMIDINDDVFSVKLCVYGFSRLDHLTPDFNRVICLIEQIIPDIRIVLFLQIGNFIIMAVNSSELRTPVTMIKM